MLNMDAWYQRISVADDITKSYKSNIAIMTMMTDMMRASVWFTIIGGSF